MENQNKNSSDHKNANEQQETPKVEIKSQENILSGLSDKELSQAAETDHQTLDSTANVNSVNNGLSEKVRSEAAEADGKIDDIEGGLSDKERREAADESW